MLFNGSQGCVLLCLCNAVCPDEAIPLYVTEFTCTYLSLTIWPTDTRTPRRPQQQRLRLMSNAIERSIDRTARVTSKVTRTFTGLCCWSDGNSPGNTIRTRMQWHLIECGSYDAKVDCKSITKLQVYYASAPIGHFNIKWLHFAIIICHYTCRAAVGYVVPASLPTIDRSLDSTKLHRSLFRDSYKLLYFPGGYYTTHNIVIVVAVMTFIDTVNFDCHPISIHKHF